MLLLFIALINDMCVNKYGDFKIIYCMDLQFMKMTSSCEAERQILERVLFVSEDV